MDRVKSTQLHSAGHDAGGLRLSFHCACNKAGAGTPRQSCDKCGGSGTPGVYTYPDVPREHFEAIRDAAAKGESTGAVFARLVKKGGFKFTYAPHST